MYKLITVAFVLIGCYKKDSTNTVSYSDNKTFANKKYAKNEPVRPFGNIVSSKDDETRTIIHYSNIVDTKLSYLKENEDYLLWLASQRRKRLASGQLNGFKQETTPGSNAYYIQKTKDTRKNNSLISERFYLDIDRQIRTFEMNSKKTASKPKDDKIDDYTILNNPQNYDAEVVVDGYDYHKSY
jgi:hypothetical protein